jgi:hypothetical protein
MKLQYYHGRIFTPIKKFSYSRTIPTEMSSKGGFTVVIQTPETWLLPTLKEGDFFVKQVGIVKCSMDDLYCRKTGRDLALESIKPTKLTVKLAGEFTTTLEDERKNIYVFRSFHGKVILSEVLLK